MTSRPSLLTSHSCRGVVVSQLTDEVSGVAIIRSTISHAFLQQSAKLHTPLSFRGVFRHVQHIQSYEKGLSQTKEFQTAATFLTRVAIFEKLAWCSTTFLIWCGPGAYGFLRRIDIVKSVTPLCVIVQLVDQQIYNKLN